MKSLSIKTMILNYLSKNAFTYAEKANFDRVCMMIFSSLEVQKNCRLNHEHGASLRSRFPYNWGFCKKAYMQEGKISKRYTLAVKILWKSPALSHTSMAFQKQSPLLPFFNYAYTKLRQSGTLYRINRKWSDKSIVKCESDPLEQISFYKIVSLITLLMLGILCSTVILAFERFKKSRKSSFPTEKVF